MRPLRHVLRPFGTGRGPNPLTVLLAGGIVLALLGLLARLPVPPDACAFVGTAVRCAAGGEAARTLAMTVGVGALIAIAAWPLWTWCTGAPPGAVPEAVSGVPRVGAPRVGAAPDGPRPAVLGGVLPAAGEGGGSEAIVAAVTAAVEAQMADGAEAEGGRFPLDPGALGDEVVRLQLVRTRAAEPATGRVPDYTFDVLIGGTEDEHPFVVGQISFRVSTTRRMTHVCGQVGYAIAPLHRGHGYAARALLALLPFARRHGLRTLWVTCDPANAGSRRTLERAGFNLVEEVEVPPAERLGAIGPRVCRFGRNLTAA